VITLNKQLYKLFNIFDVMKSVLTSPV